MHRGRSAVKEGDAAHKPKVKNSGSGKLVTSKQIKTILDLLGISRVDIARNTGIDVMHIRRLMSGKISDDDAMKAISVFLRSELKRLGANIR